MHPTPCSIAQLEKIKSSQREILWVTLWVIGGLLAFGWTFHYYYVDRERLWRAVGVQLIVARTGAAVLRYCFGLILFCVAHRTTRM